MKLTISAFMLLWAVTAGAAVQVVDPPQLLGAVTTPNVGFDVILAGHYALVADYLAGFHVIDVADPTSPAIVGTLDTPGLAVHLAIAGSIAFVADHAAGGVRFIDVSNKSSPTLVGSYVSGSTAVMVAWYEGLLVVGYLEGMFDLVDVTSLSSPTLVTTYATTGPPREAVFDGDIMFITDSGFGLRIVDISTSAAPSLSGSVAANRPIGLDRAGDVVYLADLDGIKSFDVSDRTAPVVLDALSLPAPGVRVRIQDTFAILADHLEGGLQVVDVTTPSAMSPATEYVTGYYAYGLAVRGELAYLVDREGLKIFRVLDATVPVRGTTLGGLKAGFRGGDGE